jgi:Fur family transcriptional regulator, ferric uptake regulator
MINAKIQHDCKTELNDVALRATPARLALMRLFEGSDKPIDVQTMIEYLEKKDIETDPATVFRIVNLFKEKGLLHPIQLNEGKFRYELSSKPHHHHFVCEKCGAIEDISDFSIKAIEEDIQKKRDIKINSHSLEFFGICADCQQ